jgi:hypothetical protein
MGVGAMNDGRPFLGIVVNTRQIRNLLRAERCEDGADMSGGDNACGWATDSTLCSKALGLTTGIVVIGEYEVDS